MSDMMESIYLSLMSLYEDDELETKEADEPDTKEDDKPQKRTKFIVRETPRMYKRKRLPKIEAMPTKSCKWVRA